MPANEAIIMLAPGFRDEFTHLLVHLFRNLTAYEMLTNFKRYETFLPALEGLPRIPPHVPLSVETAVQYLVLKDGVDAEHLMIQALATLLLIPLAVVYASGDAPVRVCLPPAFAGVPGCRLPY
jgi:hypothetical protein